MRTARVIAVTAAASMLTTTLCQAPSADATPDPVDRPVATRYGSDFDGDGKSDIAVWRPSDGTWYVRRSSDGGVTTQQWGQRGDKPVPGDYDGDGRTDFAVWRPSEGKWHLLQTRDGYRVQEWGQGQWDRPDVPVHGDFDGDGRHDIAIVRVEFDPELFRVVSTWWIVPSSGGAPVRGRSTDMVSQAHFPTGNFDADSDSDLVQVSTSSHWLAEDLAGNYLASEEWLSEGDIPVAGDFNGDWRQDFAVYRPSEFTWAVEYSFLGDQQFTRVVGGDAQNIPVSGDYDGDGRSDVAVWTPTTGHWVVTHSSTGHTHYPQWGTTGDIPV